jgi:DNA-binding NtrC family response regulator
MLLEKVVVVGKSVETQELGRAIAEAVFSADDTHDAHELVGSIRPDMVIVDETIHTEHWRNFLDTINEKGNALPVVLIGEDENAEEFAGLGGYAVVGEADREERLSEIARKIWTKRLVAGTAAAGAGMIVGHSAATKRLCDMITMVAKSACNPVLIMGETGTGKEVAAKAVHAIRHGEGEVFVGINCAALTATLLESELFGHVKGAFTGAEKEKTGLLELAGTGTVLLDEISEMPLDLQAKLLRVLQERTFRKVGGTKEIALKATVIASSNRNLSKEAAAGKFRQDLYYRLSICPIIISPLRAANRSGDIAVLAEHFLRTATICPEKTGKITGFTKLAMEALCRYDWPGNVRELRNVIDRAIMFETTDKIGTASLVFNPEAMMGEEDGEGTAAASASDFSLERAEKELIGRALQEAGWQKTRAAGMLGITRATLYAKVKQYDIRIPAEAGVE